MNPLKEARLDRNLTQRQVARLSGLTVNAIIKYEQGLYSKPSPRLIASLNNNLYEQMVLIERYEKWIYDTRCNADLPFTKNEYSGYTRPVGMHPFEHYRTSSLGFKTRLSFCKTLALHPSIVAEYEAGRTREMPVSITSALTDAGVKPELILLLDKLGIDTYNARLYESAS